jgi:hypothetical protein
MYLFPRVNYAKFHKPPPVNFYFYCKDVSRKAYSLQYFVKMFCIRLLTVSSVWEGNMKMDLREVGGGCGDWMALAQDRDRWRALVSTLRKLRVPKMRGTSLLAAEPVSFSRRTLLHGVSK